MIKSVSPKIAKKLKDAGFPQEDVGLSIAKSSNPKKFIATPTAEEIFDEYPELIVLPEGGRILIKVLIHITSKNIEYQVSTEGLRHIDNKKEVVFSKKDNLADPAGEMWLYLEKEGFI